jgi:predicted metal-binding membrane protein
MGWWWTVDEMQGMYGGPWADLGTLAWFGGVWVVMMAAMMFPSVAPTVALYSRMTKSRSPVDFSGQRSAQLLSAFAGVFNAEVGELTPANLVAACRGSDLISPVQAFASVRSCALGRHG